MQQQLQQTAARRRPGRTARVVVGRLTGSIGERVAQVESERIINAIEAFKRNARSHDETEARVMNTVDVNSYDWAAARKAHARGKDWEECTTNPAWLRGAAQKVYAHCLSEGMNPQLKAIGVPGSITTYIVVPAS
jgi:hypothetical protein